MGNRYTSKAFASFAKSRKGRPSISLQTLIDRAKVSAFLDELQKLSEEVRPDEAIDAAKILSEKPKNRIVRHAEAGVIPGAAAPLAAGIGRATKALVDAKHGRLGAAGRAFRDTTRGGVVSDAVKGVLLGSGLSVGREGINMSRARKTYDAFMRQHGEK